MNLFLHAPESDSKLAKYYSRAFEQASELFIVNAYLTEWNARLALNNGCRRFRLIVGKDFGITRKTACEAVMRWLPPERKSQFMVADLISGFHPKAVFWKESRDRCFAIIGSSNLTRAAFKNNYEANVFSQISMNEYKTAKQWIRSIEKQAITVSESWLSKYKEAAPVKGGGGKKAPKPQAAIPLIALKLPRPAGTKEIIKLRRQKLAKFKKHRDGLINLFKKCAKNKNYSGFYDELCNKHWSEKISDRLQGPGWERAGKGSNFHELSKSYLRILGEPDEARDDAIAEEIDRLKQRRVVTRKAFLSETLCLEYPGEYPVLNKPVQDYLVAANFKAPRGASEGSRYIDLARKLRFSLLQNPNHPAKNLAELDAVIWQKFSKKRGA